MDTKELKEQLKLLQDIISAYETLNKLKGEAVELDNKQKEYIPYPVYPYPYPCPPYPTYPLTTTCDSGAGEDIERIIQ